MSGSRASQCRSAISEQGSLSELHRDIAEEIHMYVAFEDDHEQA